MNTAALQYKINLLETQLKGKENEIQQKDAIICEKDNLILELREKVTILEILHYGPKSEKWTKEDERQALLFNEAEDDAFRQSEEEKRKKKWSKPRKWAPTPAERTEIRGENPSPLIFPVRK